MGPGGVGVGWGRAGGLPLLSVLISSGRGAEQRGEARPGRRRWCCRLPPLHRHLLGLALRGAARSVFRLHTRPASPIPASRSRFNGTVTSIDVSSRHTVGPATFTYIKEIRALKKKKKSSSSCLSEKRPRIPGAIAPCGGS